MRALSCDLLAKLLSVLLFKGIALGNVFDAEIVRAVKKNVADIVEVLKNIAGAAADDDTGFPLGKALYDLGLKIEDVLVGGVVAACGRLDDALIGAALF